MAKNTLAAAGKAFAALAMVSGMVFAQQMGGQHSQQSAQPTVTQHVSDRAFAKKAAEGGAAEVALSKLAERKGNVAAVRDFGQRIVKDHSDVGEQLQAAASNENIELTEKMSPKDQRTYGRLEKLSGPAFDHAYARNMLTDHEHDVAMFRQEANDGKNPAIKEFASNTLPILEHHLELARMMNQEVSSGATHELQHAPTGASQQGRSQKPISRN